MLLEEILSKTNMQLAYKRVTGNKGAAGVDGIAAADFTGQLKAEWEAVKAKLEAGTYLPQAVKRVTIPKPNGGERKLGIAKPLLNCTPSQTGVGICKDNSSFHPQYNQQFQVLKAKIWAGKLVLSIQGTDSGTFGIQADWTDYFPSDDDFSCGTNEYISVGALLALCEMVKNLDK